MAALFLSTLVAPLGLPAFAHDVSTGYISVIVRPNRVELIVTMVADQVRQFNSDPEAVGSRFLEYVQTHVHLKVNADPVAVQWTNPAATPEEFPSLFNAESAAEIDLAQQTGRAMYTHLLGAGSAVKAPWKIEVAADFSDRFGENHTFLLKLADSNQTQTAVLTKTQNRAEFYLNGKRWIWGQNLQFVRLGIGHIFLGYDHLLFLLALLVIGGSWPALIKVITSFTVAHSLTLVLSVLGWVVIPSRVVESAIALTIIYVGLENFFLKSAGSHRWRLTFVFGLIHGCGFAGVLKELGLPARGLMAALFSFNVGVEIGQFVILLCLLPLIGWVSATRFRMPVVRVISGIVVFLGTVWFLERALGMRILGYI